MSQISTHGKNDFAEVSKKNLGSFRSENDVGSSK